MLCHWLAAPGEISGTAAEAGWCGPGKEEAHVGVWQVPPAEIVGAVGLVPGATVAPRGAAH